MSKHSHTVHTIPYTVTYGGELSLSLFPLSFLSFLLSLSLFLSLATPKTHSIYISPLSSHLDVVTAPNEGLVWRHGRGRPRVEGVENLSTEQERAITRNEIGA